MEELEDEDGVMMNTEHEERVRRDPLKIEMRRRTERRGCFITPPELRMKQSTGKTPE